MDGANLSKTVELSGEDPNWMFWSQACTPSQNQRRQPCVLVSQFLKFLRLPYSSLVPHHKQGHWKSHLWQYAASTCQIGGAKEKWEDLIPTSAMCWVPRLANTSVHSFQTKPAFPYLHCRALTPGLGVAGGFGTPQFLSARNMNRSIKADWNMMSEKNCHQKYLLLFSTERWNVLKLCFPLYSFSF